MDVFDFLFKIGILKQLVLSEVIERSGGFFEDLNLHRMLKALAVDLLNSVLNIADERDVLPTVLHLPSAGIASLNAFLDPVLGVVISDGFCTGETLLPFGTEGDVFAGFDFISGVLHQLQKLIVVLCCDHTAINGLLEFLLPTCTAFGFGVFLVVHAFSLRGRNN